MYVYIAFVNWKTIKIFFLNNIKQLPPPLNKVVYCPHFRLSIELALELRAAGKLCIKSPLFSYNKDTTHL